MKKPRHSVTDHAVLRYLERVQGMDIEAVRRGIGRRIDALTEGHDGMCSVVIEGHRFIIVEDRVVTCTLTSEPKRGQGGRRGKKPPE